MNPADIETIFFDLDNTLFDHTRAEQTTLRQLLKTPPFMNGVDEDDFLLRYDRNNRKLWRQMAEGKISADELRILRFETTCSEFGLQNVDGRAWSERYLEIYCKHGFTVAYAREVLDYLQPKYTLGILSNGFVSIQKIKLENTELQPFFEYEIYSGDVGVMKPAPEIFTAAREKCGSEAHQIAFVGDSYESDIEGGSAVGWNTIWFDYDDLDVEKGIADHRISDLRELVDIF